MSFSEEWNEVYKHNKQLSIWPWTDLVSLVNRYTSLKAGSAVLELGCGAGANIPFLAGFDGINYYAVEGSNYIVNRLKEKYKNKVNVFIKCGDFTKEIPFEEKFDLIVDRSAITHNRLPDIKKILSLVAEKLKAGGVFIGVDWHSVCYSFFQEDIEEYEVIDERTRIYKTGDFAGSGITHFSDEAHIRELLDGFDIKVLYEKKYTYSLPRNEIRGSWNFVAVKR